VPVFQSSKFLGKFIRAKIDALLQTAHDFAFIGGDQMQLASGKLSVPTRLRTAILAFLIAPTVVFVASQASAAGDDAKQIFKAMSDYLAAQKTISATFDSAIEVITPALEKIQFASSGTLLLSRPSAIKATRTGGYSDVEMVFDGKAVTIFGKNINGYAQIDAPGSVDQLIDTLRDRGMAIPGADLLLSNVYDTLIGDVLEAKYIGHGVVGGVECDHLAFRDQETDWQLWIERGDKPIPRKYVITTKSMGAAPQYTLTITDWKTDVETTDADFTFTPPEGAKKLGQDALAELNDVPPPAEPVQ